jgi:iron complex outermembrane receptor protein
MTKALLLVSTAITVLWAAPAFSQTTSAAAASRAAAPAQNAGAPTTAVQEVVVTAQRRTENLQKSSVSIQVFSGQALRQVRNAEDLSTLTPGVVIANRGSSPQVFIHGVGDQSSDNTGIGAVAFNVDGVYYARQEAAGPEMFDLQRIEILTGPQGTLYGRNATGGAVNILTNQPKLGSYGGYVSGEYGSFDLYREEVAINLPIGSTAALRIAEQSTDQNGYLSNGLDDDHSKALRARLLWEPNDRDSILFNLDSAEVTGKGGGFAVYPAVGGNPWRSITQQPLLYPFDFNASTAPLSQPNDSVVDSHNYGGSIEANADLGWAKLTLIPSFRYQDIYAVQYSTNSRFAEDATTREPTVELRLSNSSGGLKWVAGAYFYDEILDVPDSLTQNSFTGGTLDTQRLAYAGFGQATYSVTDKFRLIAGLRYTEETITGTFANGGGAFGDPLNPYHETGPDVALTPIRENRLNYKVGAEYDLAPNSMAYITDATGFKAGGVSAAAGCGSEAYKPEDLSALTGGIRNRFLDNRLQLNGEAFYWQYTNQQIAVVTENPCGGTQQLIVNPGDATIKGGNWDAIYRLTSSDTLHGSVEYADAEYTSFAITQRGAGPYAAGLGSACSSSAAGGGYFNIDCQGEELARTPKWSGTAGYEHVFELGDNKLTFDVDGQFASARYLDIGYGPNDLAPGYARLNTELTFASKDRWTLGVYVDNITNAAVYSGGLNLASTPKPTILAYAASIAPPRTAGIRLRMNFGS